MTLKCGNCDGTEWQRGIPDGTAGCLSAVISAMLRLPKPEVPQGLKPGFEVALGGTAEQAAEKLGNEDLPQAASPSSAKALAYRAGSG